MQGYQELYYGGGLATSENGLISILAGQALGGGTVVNYMKLHSHAPKGWYWPEALAQEPFFGSWRSVSLSRRDGFYPTSWRLPEPGELIQVRSRRWLVEGSRTTTGDPRLSTSRALIRVELRFTPYRQEALEAAGLSE